MNSQQKPQPIKNATAAPKISVMNLDEDILYNEELEKACLGALLINPNHYHHIKRILDNGKAFWYVRHYYIWQAIEYLADNDMDIDMVTISNRLLESGQLKDIGGPAYLTQLMRETPTSVHATTYAGMIQRFYAKRQIYKMTDDIKKSVKRGDISLEEVIGNIQSRLDETMLEISSRLIVTMKDRNDDHLNEAEIAMKKGEVIQGIKTGITGLDNVLDGLLPNTYVIGARRHNGKTVVLTTIAINAAKAGKSVLFINAADGNEQTVMNNILGMCSGLPPEMLRRRTWNPQQYSLYINTLSKTSKWNLFIEHKHGITPKEIKTKAELIRRSSAGLDLIVIDYLQRLGVGDGISVYKNEYERLSYVSSAMNTLCKKFDVPVVYGAQLIRQDDDKHPYLDTVKGSGNIEEDVDCGMTLWKRDRLDNAIAIRIEKNKVNNQYATVVVHHDKQTGYVS